MKICMVSSEFPPYSLGGIGQYVYNLAKKLIEMGNEVEVITRSNKIYSYSSCFEGINVHRINFLFIPPFHIKLHGHYLNKFFQKKMKNKGFDLIHYHSPLVPIINSDLPTVTTFHSCWKTEQKIYSISNDWYSVYVTLFHKLFTKNEEKIIFKTSKFTAVSPEIASDLKELYGVTENIKIVNNGVDSEYFTPINNENEINYNILFSGRLVRGKGLIDLINASEKVINKFPDVNFILAGSGPIKAELHKLTGEKGLDKNYKILGHVNKEQIRNLYQKSSIFILPSYSEGFPTSILEAMSCGVPIIGTDIPGINNAVINLENGLLVPIKNPKELSNAIIFLLEKTDLRKKMGQKSREIAKNRFDWEIIAKDFIEVYND